MDKFGISVGVVIAIIVVVGVLVFLYQGIHLSTGTTTTPQQSTATTTVSQPKVNYTGMIPYLNSSNIGPDFDLLSDQNVSGPP